MVETSWVVFGKQMPLHISGSSVFQMCEKRLFACSAFKLPGILASSSSIFGRFIVGIYKTNIHKPTKSNADLYGNQPAKAY